MSQRIHAPKPIRKVSSLSKTNNLDSHLDNYGRQSPFKAFSAKIEKPLFYKNGTQDCIINFEDNLELNFSHGLQEESAKSEILSILNENCRSSIKTYNSNGSYNLCEDETSPVRLSNPFFKNFGKKREEAYIDFTLFLENNEEEPLQGTTL